MKMGTKSLLFGAHQFLWHPITLLLAWIDLHGKIPNWKICVCIFIHDWGYWGCPNMEGEEGQEHPVMAANIAGTYLGEEWAWFCLFHSRTYASKYHSKPSPLCWVDKLCVKYDPWWLYLPRVWLSGG